jgi:ribosome maturation factor RimP
VGKFPLFVYEDSENMDDMREHISAIVEREGAIVEEIRIPEKGGTLRVVCDTEKGINSEDIVRISKKILNDPDYDTRYAEHYDLEVSSPGIDARLTLPRHFRKNRNRDIDLYHSLDGVKCPLQAKILDTEADALLLDVRKSRKETETLRIPFEKIGYAVIKLKW